MRMCQLGLVLTVFTMNIAASSQLPPKLAACRIIDKVRESMDYIFPAGGEHYSVCNSKLAYQYASVYTKLLFYQYA